MAQLTKNFAIDGSERSVQDILSKLRFISKIAEGEKLDVQSKTLSEVTVYSRASRTVRNFMGAGETREATLEFIRGVISDAFDMASSYLSMGEPFLRHMGLLIVQSLDDSKKGLVCLTRTYDYDRMFVARIEALLATLEAKTQDLQHRVGLERLESSPSEELPSGESPIIIPELFTPGTSPH